ncbi:hypothetical protein JW826_04770 [Candidatus Woesearchaeota archaeon]|nr:hypothetical protein [Candidatus Woesearchaeota archaeon]
MSLDGFFLGEEERLEPTEPPFRLHRNQGYVSEVAATRQIPVKLLGHPIETRTCDEKAELLSSYGWDWDRSRVVKALYFSSIDAGDKHYVCVITPETGRLVDVEAILTSYAAKTEAQTGQPGRYKLNGVPRGMSHGTCTPFPSHDLVRPEGAGRIDRFFVLKFPELDDKLVDISVGGGTKEARKTSMHLPYGGIHAILSERFGDSVVALSEPRYAY